MEKPYLIPIEDGLGNPFEERHYYKIYNDGGHYVGTRVVRSKGKRPPKRPAQTAFDIAFDSLYFQAVKQGLKNDAMADFIQAGLEKLYPASSTLRKYILEKIDKKQRNLWKRIKRFRRKANMYRWNYFVTFTYDPKKHTAESFRKKLRKCLSNLHTRRGWKYMGVFEEGGENGTLHFHALLYVPKDEMIGRIIEKNEYSLKRRKRYTRYGNTFFDENFGMSDFQELNPILLKRGGTIKYLIKYIVKTGEKIVYSRGIPAEICKEIADSDIAGTFLNFVTKYVLFDDVIDWERDIKNYGKMQRLRL
ncbi:MAG: hypothetical protein IJ308_09030 [Clostridia bacterium]|nr:hypothetical protein [Clostridia bacterium]